jgi:Zn-dependent metalloprotease
MNRFFSIIIILLISGNIFSQIYTGSKANELVEGAELIRFKDFTEAPAFIRFNQSVTFSGVKALNYYKDMIANDLVGFELVNMQKNSGNQRTERYVQTLNGIPVEFSRLQLHSEGDRIYAINGEVLDNPQINGSFNISEDQALQSALYFVDADIYMWQDASEEALLKRFRNDENASYYPIAEKIYAPVDIEFSGQQVYSAYKFDIYSKIPHNRQYIYINASNGEVLYTKQIMTGYVEGVANTAYSGEQTITTEFTSGMYRLRDGTRGNGVETFNCQNTASYNDAVDFLDDDNYWDNYNEFLNEYATDAHFATSASYDYFFDIHGRNSIDGDGHALHSYVHFSLIDNGMPSNVNAFWNGQWMTYGDGNPAQGITPLTTVDICAHEVTHGLTSYTCQLVYQDEPGALNEAFSDIFGAAVEFWAVPEYADWTIGEDIGLTIRDMSNPKSRQLPDTYLGQYWVFGEEDYGGVHTNNGPLCYWFYLLSEGGNGVNDNGDSYTVDAIGIEKAEQISFRMQTVYLTPTSQYYDAWFYGMQATADLYGACSPETKSVGDAFRAIGVSEPYVHDVYADFYSNFTENCQPGFEISFVNLSYNGYDYSWDFGDGSPLSTELNPSHTYTDYGSFDVSLTVSGECGESTFIRENYVIIDPDLPCVTIMPTSGQINFESCSGFIYDHGGPDNNYYNDANSYLTLSHEDAEHYILMIHEFDIEPGSGSVCNYDFLVFYDGPDATYPIINETFYCNTTGNPNIIYSSGNSITIRFKTDQALTMGGFEIEYFCLGVDNPPIALFSHDKSFTCEGKVTFTDESINNVENWQWDFGDGNTSSEQNPVHLYQESGVYSVSLTVSNENGENELVKNNIITVSITDMPEFDQNIIGCTDTAFEIFLDIGDNVLWFNNILDTEPVYTGSTVEHPPIEDDVIYYLREIIPGETHNIGPTNNTDGGGYFGNVDHIHYLVFDAYTDFKINTVKVNAQNNEVRTIALRNSDFEIIEQTHFFATEGVSEVEINIDVPAGEDLQLVGMGAPNLFRTNSAAYLNYPYTIEDVVSIKHSSAGTEPTSYYYYFYDWNISTTDCYSKTETLNIGATDCLTLIEDKSVLNVTIFPNPGDGIVYFSGLSLVSNVMVSVTDISGRVIMTETLKQENMFDISELAKGIYIINIYTEGLSTSLKYILK